MPEERNHLQQLHDALNDPAVALPRPERRELIHEVELHLHSLEKDAALYGHGSDLVRLDLGTPFLNGREAPKRIIMAVYALGEGIQ